MSSPRRLQKNHGRYHGQTIDIDDVVLRALRAARARGWSIETFHSSPGCELHALTRIRATGRAGVYLSTGIHGDEPAGPLAALRLLEEDGWPDRLNLWLCPCLNPTGFRANTRENAGGIDLNRQYLHREAAEVRSHIAWLDRQPEFDLCLCLHEDWEARGFYVYELNPDNQPSLAGPMIESVRPVCPIDNSDLIEGRPAEGGIIRPSADPRTRPQWPEAFYLFTRKTRLSYTLEAPSDFEPSVRVDALVAATRAALESLR
jgi:hypothetical protein